MSKQCSQCSQTKPLSEFYTQPKSRGGGHISKCKICTSANVRAHRRLNESVREYDRRRGSRRPLEKAREWREAHPDAYRAHNAVNNALRDGRLTKEPCLFCSEVKVHAHHQDYNKPLDVIWLCPRCHHRLHAHFPETAAHEPEHRRAA